MMENGKQFRQVHSTCWCAEHRLADCDYTDVSVQVLSTVPVMFSYWAKPEDTLDLARYLNDHIAQMVAENPKRFAGKIFIFKLFSLFYLFTFGSSYICVDDGESLKN